MKKTIIWIIVAIVLVAAIALGLVWYFVWNDSAYIGRDAAAEAALADAGFTRQEVEQVKAFLRRMLQNLEAIWDAPEGAHNPPQERK